MDVYEMLGNYQNWLLIRNLYLYWCGCTMASTVQTPASHPGVWSPRPHPSRFMGVGMPSVAMALVACSLLVSFNEHIDVRAIPSRCRKRGSRIDEEAYRPLKEVASLEVSSHR
jgi:hypothetical protein